MKHMFCSQALICHGMLTWQCKHAKQGAETAHQPCVWVCGGGEGSTVYVCERECIQQGLIKF